MIPVLTGCNSAETAHISFAYPMGFRRKCLHRSWVETATKGAGKGQQRFVTQTTHNSFNDAYTTKLNDEGAEVANAWALEQVAAGRVRWNATKCSTYNGVAVMYLEDLGDGSGRLGVTFAALHMYSGPEGLNKLMNRFTGFDADQIKQIAAWEAESRRYNRAEWEKYEANAVPVAA
jgi:hypothetical protein